jgi:hydrogenase nickel incorporation protein HypA/HybF
MHELGLASSIFDILRQYVPGDQAARVRRVHVKVGELAGVVPDSLAFCFDAIVEGTPYRSAVLDIERVPTRGVCAGCGATSPVQPPVFACPVCRSPHITMVSGQELSVSDVEVDDEATEGGHGRHHD